MHSVCLVQCSAQGVASRQLSTIQKIDCTALVRRKTACGWRHANKYDGVFPVGPADLVTASAHACMVQSAC